MGVSGTPQTLLRNVSLTEWRVVSQKLTNCHLWQTSGRVLKVGLGWCNMWAVPSPSPPPKAKKAVAKLRPNIQGSRWPCFAKVVTLYWWQSSLYIVLKIKANLDCNLTWTCLPVPPLTYPTPTYATNTNRLIFCCSNQKYILSIFRSMNKGTCIITEFQNEEIIV